MRARAKIPESLILGVLPCAYLLLAFAMRVPAALLPAISSISLPYVFNGYLAALGQRFYFNGHPGMPFTLFVGPLS